MFLSSPELQQGGVVGVVAAVPNANLGDGFLSARLHWVQLCLVLFEAVTLWSGGGTYLNPRIHPSIGCCTSVTTRRKVNMTRSILYYWLTLTDSEILVAVLCPTPTNPSFQGSARYSKHAPPNLDIIWPVISTPMPMLDLKNLRHFAVKYCSEATIESN